MNTFVSIIKRIRLWGAKGVWDYFLRQVYNYRTRRFLMSNAREHPLSPKPGVTVLADMTHRSSLSKTMRDLVFALHRAGIPVQVFDLHPRADLPEASIKDVITPLNEFKILKYSHVIEMFSSPLPKVLPLKRTRILFWEFTTGLLEYNPSVGDAETIVAMSDFNYDIFKRIMPSSCTVKKILYPFFFETNSIPDKALIRKRYGIPEKAFVVFFNFDYGSSFNRKNPDGTMQAFAKALANQDDAFLVFKTKGSSQHQLEREKLLSLANSLGIAQKIVMIDNYIPQLDVYGLTGACDVYLSLHRGEGFGLGIAEAMSLAKPVVATDYSSTTEFCNKANSIPVPYSIVKVPEGMHDHPCYHAVKEWAEPDTNEAAKAIARLYNDPSLRLTLGAAAKAFIEEHFSTENFRKSINDFLAG